MIFKLFYNSLIVDSFGWVLFHSIWQIALIAVVLRLLLKVSSKTSANFRYWLANAALMFVLVLIVATFVRQINLLTNTQNKIRATQIEFENVNFQDKQSVALNPDISKGDEKLFAVNSDNELHISFRALQTQAINFLSKFSPYLVWLWLFGVVMFAARTTGGLWQLQILQRKQTKVVTKNWQQKFAELCEKTGVAQTTKILESASVAAPIVIGWLKPIVLVPSGALLGLSAKEFETILVHELIHIRRHDFLFNLIQTAIEILLFYHPCVWSISRKIRELREFACDDAVVQFYGERLNYASALANLEQLRSAQAQSELRQLSIAANGGKLMLRIKRILNKETEISRANSLWSAGLALVLISAFLTVLLWVGNSVSVNAKSPRQGKKIAIGFVSIPPVDRSDNPPHDSQATMQILLEKLKAHRVPAIGFLQGSMISDGNKLFPVRSENVRAWRDAGFEIGIGGFKHIWFYHTPFADYVANVEKNEVIARQILAEKNLPLRYFSYPFLNTGKSVEDKNRFEGWLAERNLRSVKYTFDNQEWMYSYAYDVARKDNDIARIKEIRIEFLDYMSKMLFHYEAYSNEMFGRDVAQTMVLTPSRLVADTADDFFSLLKKQNYSFVPIDEAQSDEAYKTEENFAGKSGISWFERWTITQNRKLRDEPQVNAAVEKIWNQAKK